MEYYQPKVSHNQIASVQYLLISYRQVLDKFTKGDWKMANASCIVIILFTIAPFLWKFVWHHTCWSNHCFCYHNLFVKLLDKVLWVVSSNEAPCKSRVELICSLFGNSDHQILQILRYQIRMVADRVFIDPHKITVDDEPNFITLHRLATWIKLR